MSRAFVAGRRTSHSHEKSRSVLNPVQRPSCTEKCICLKKLHVALEHPPSRVERHLQVRRGGPRPRPRRLVHRGCKWRPTYNPEPSQVAICDASNPAIIGARAMVHLASSGAYPGTSVQPGGGRRALRRHLCGGTPGPCDQASKREVMAASTPRSGTGRIVHTILSNAYMF